MTTYPCPNGHDSTADDYCDTCGAPIAAAGAGGADAGPPAAPAPSTGPTPGAAPDAPPATGVVTCPHCSTDNPAGSLFCEACGYDFTTGTMPRPRTATAHPAPSTWARRARPRSPSPAARRTGRRPPDLAAAPEAAAPVAPAVPVEWVTEVWVDPDWYDAQESEETCPSPGLPVIVPLSRQSVLIGRPVGQPQHPPRRRLLG